MVKYSIGDTVITKCRTEYGDKGNIFTISYIEISCDGIFYKRDQLDNGVKQDKVTKITYEIMEDV